MVDLLFSFRMALGSVSPVSRILELQNFRRASAIEIYSDSFSTPIISSQPANKHPAISDPLPENGEKILRGAYLSGGNRSEARWRVRDIGLTVQVG